VVLQSKPVILEMFLESMLCIQIQLMQSFLTVHKFYLQIVDCLILGRYQISILALAGLASGHFLQYLPNPAPAKLWPDLAQLQFSQTIYS